eukprot:1578342-Rhodomonas_salina.1
MSRVGHVRVWILWSSLCSTRVRNDFGGASSFRHRDSTSGDFSALMQIVEVSTLLELERGHGFEVQLQRTITLNRRAGQEQGVFQT